MPVIQEFVKRDLGEGDLRNIDIVGAHFEHVKEKFISAAKRQKKLHAQPKGPQTWGGHAYNALESLIREGYFKQPNGRTMNAITEALEAKGLSTKGMESKITSSLNRRIKSGVLKKTKTPEGWVYWAD
jgi:hypothetical protein